MIFSKGSSALLALALASLASAGGTVSVTATAGSVAGKDTTSSGGNWLGLTGSAQTAKITYDHAIGANSPISSSNEFKLVDNNGNFGAHLFAGDHAVGADGRVDVSGASSISNAYNGAPTYYQATWSSTVQKSNIPNPAVFSGTYDPWDIHYADIKALGTPDLGTADLYYQTSLLGGFQSPSGFDLGSGYHGNYDFSVSLTTATQTLHFIDIQVDSTGTVGVQFNNYANFDIYLLGSGAHNDGLTPDARVNATDAMKITSSSQLGSILNASLNPNGSLQRNLDFGIVYRNYQLQPSSDPTKTLFSWHTDTVSRITPVPEPASMVALGLGALSLLRRRRKA